MKKLIIPTLMIFTLLLTGCATEKPAEVEKVNLDQTKAEADLGYSISYPSNWQYKRLENNAVVISGQKGSDAELAVIQIQSYPKGEKYESIQQVIDEFKQTATNTKAQFSGERDYTYTLADGTKLKGRQLAIIMPELGINQKQVLLPSANDKYIYHWSYTTPVMSYNKYLNVAEAVLESWEIKK